jgi:hypothetical protein
MMSGVAPKIGHFRPFIGRWGLAGTDLTIGKTREIKRLQELG